MIDCSPEAQEERANQIAALRASLFSGVHQITDRNRSVTYQGNADKMALLLMLENEQDYCDGVPRRGRFCYAPIVKGL